MKSYQLKLGNKEYKLRLTASAQKQLLKEKDKSFFEIIFDCMMDPLESIDIFTQALNYKGNENSIADGEELFDEMVDAGFEGPERFFSVVAEIAQTSGIINADGRTKLERAVAGLNQGLYSRIENIESVFDKMEEAEEEAGEDEKITPFPK